MTKMTRWLLLAGLLAGACSAVPAPTSAPIDRLPVQIDSVDVLQLESYPVQLMLHVTGWLPNPCASPEWVVTQPQAAGDPIEVELFARPGPEQACIQMLEPFEVNIPLGAQAEGGARIVLNGEAVVPEGAQ